MKGFRRRRGVVLATVVLVLLAVTLLVHASLMLVGSFERGADEAWEAIRVRRATIGRLDAAARIGDTLGVGWTATGPGVDTRVDVRRLSPEVRLLVGTGRGTKARWWAGRLVWSADPETRGRAVVAGVRARGAVVAGVSAVLSGSTGACSADVGVPPVGLLPAGPLVIGALDGVVASVRLPTWIPGAAPSSCPPGGCVPVAGVASGGASVSSGVHTGLFWVRGDLTLSGTAQVRGRLVVDGDLTVTGPARIDGAVDVTGTVLVAGSGVVAADPCLVAHVWRLGVADAVGAIALERRAWPLWGPPP